MKRYAPQAYFIFFLPYNAVEWKDWSDLFAEDDRALVAADYHGYYFHDYYPTVKSACDFLNDTDSAFTKEFRDNGIEVWWGEWSLATDSCAMWLGGLNQNNTDLTNVKC